ncbi:MAG: ABC transporter permease [Cyclobacteriaceae bacterium]|nr:ABC transporter permease [Cyclobacteriaceae bacterium]
MLKNYIKIALRNLLKNKVFSFINITGLALGIACCLTLSLYIADELSYDTQHQDLDNLYRIVTTFESDKGLGFDKLGTVSPPIAMAMKDEIPEIEEAARAVNPPGVAQNLIKYEDNTFYETNGLVADSSIFDILSYTFIEGNPEQALTDGNTVVISDNLAVKLFGRASALNKIISIDQDGAVGQYKVTGVFKSNSKSFLQANFFISMMSSGGIAEYLRTSPSATDEWAGQNFVPSFLRLVKGHDKQAVEKKMNEVLRKYGTEDMKALGMNKTISLEPIKDIYLRSEVGQSPRIKYIYIIGSIAGFILLLACINFMNLSTAKATKRSMEIGIRKVLGAFRISLINQIIGEAMVTVFMAVIISIVLVQLALPFLNLVTDKSITLGSDNVFLFAGALLFLILLTGLLAGSYPAFYLSSFQPARVLKGKFALNNSAGLLRQTLVVFQFMIAIILVSGMFIISQQLRFMQEKDLGFDAKAKLVLPIRTMEASKQFATLKSELERTNLVQGVAGTAYVPGSQIWSDMAFYTEGGNMDKAILHRRNQIDKDYINLMGIKMIAGRQFTDNTEMERGKLIVNRTSAKRFGIEPEKMVGQKLHFEWQGQQYDFEVIGVMEDFHQVSLKSEINPILFELSTPDNFAFMVASVKADNFQSTIAAIEKTWNTLINDTPFEYSFLDENVQKQYTEDQKMAKMISMYTGIALVICSLGLYGLSMYMAERRIKEIGIRKVMGASVNQVVRMMSGEFIKLITIAIVIAVPVAWYSSAQWLEGFAYRTAINPIVFLYAGGAALVVALMTVSFESIKAALANPVNSLRNE